MAFPIGPLTAIMIADAVGCGFEFLPTFHKPDGLTYKQHTMWPYLPAGCYSDDTQFTLGLAEAVVRADRTYSYWLIHAYQRDPRGCSPHMKGVLEQAIVTGKLEVETKGDTAGAAMGASIFGLQPDVVSVLKFCEWQADITHAGDGVLAAKAAALMVFLMRNGHQKGQLRHHLHSVLKDERFRPAGDGVEIPLVRPGNKGIPCVLAALRILELSESFTEILTRCIDLGGDTDTTAVIAMGAAWLSREYRHDLPYSMWSGLEDGRYGRSYLREVELKLLAMCPNLTLRCD